MSDVFNTGIMCMYSFLKFKSRSAFPKVYAFLSVDHLSLYMLLILCSNNLKKGCIQDSLFKRSTNSSERSCNEEIFWMCIILQNILQNLLNVNHSPKYSKNIKFIHFLKNEKEKQVHYLVEIINLKYLRLVARLYLGLQVALQGNSSIHLVISDLM